MQNIIIQKNKAFTNFFKPIVVPPSKSQTIRAILFAFLACGKSKIVNPLFSNDTLAMLDICKLLGAKISKEDHCIYIESKGVKDHSLVTLDAKNSGLILRFLPAILSLTKTPFVVTGDASIQNSRPFYPLLEGLCQRGAGCFCLKNHGYAPAFLKGPIFPGIACIDGQDSQPVSAMLIALSQLKGKSELIVKNPGEKLWVDLTLQWLDRFDCKVKKHSSEHFTVYGNGKITPFTYTVCGDFSQSFYPIAIGLICNCEVEVHSLNFSEKQPDKTFISLLEKLGATFKVDKEHNRVTVLKESKLIGCELDIDTCIDAISVLAVLGCFAQGKTTIKNAKIARKKECDRIRATFLELKKMGANIKETEDGLIVYKSDLNGANLFSHNDHRMVFSLSCAAMGAKGKTTINQIECIGKTNTNFFEELQKIGLEVCSYF